MEHFIIPEGIKVLKSKLKVRSARVIPPFNPFNANCNDFEKSKPNINIRSNFHKTTTRADFLLYIGVINKPNDNFLAYATFCVTGKLINYYLIYFINFKMIKLEDH